MNRHDTSAWPRPSERGMSDADRITGQITRGEILAGPEGARRIAARHEAAYGAAFTRPAADAAWGDALTALRTTSTSTTTGESS